MAKVQMLVEFASEEAAASFLAGEAIVRDTSGTVFKSESNEHNLPRVGIDPSQNAELNRLAQDIASHIVNEIPASCSTLELWERRICAVALPTEGMRGIAGRYSKD